MIAPELSFKICRRFMGWGQDYDLLLKQCHAFPEDVNGKNLNRLTLNRPVPMHQLEIRSTEPSLEDKFPPHVEA